MDADEHEDRRPLGHPLREKIIHCLEDGRELPTTVICLEVTEPSLSIVSYHLKVLEEAGLVRSDGSARPTWSRA